jgi:hypothetical protein
MILFEYQWFLNRWATTNLIVSGSVHIEPGQEQHMSYLYF